MQWIPERLKEPFRSVLGKEHPFGLAASARRNLRRLPRFQHSTVQLFGHDLTVVDAASFLASHEEIFEDQIYRLPAETQDPVIIDAGANIGLASIFFHLANPKSRITAIESDPAIHQTLCNNLKSFGAANVEVMHGAVWKNAEQVCFAQDHADGGRISNAGGTVVNGIRLRDLLDGKRIDLLKMDIEGAETEVLLDCEGAMDGVQRLFVEYHSFVNQPQSLSALLGALERSGFRYHIRQTGVYSAYPLVNFEQEAGFDLQLNIFAIRKELL